MVVGGTSIPTTTEIGSSAPVLPVETTLSTTCTGSRISPPRPRLGGGISHDAKVDAPQCPRPASEGVRVTGDALAAVIVTAVKRGLRLGKGKEQEHFNRVVGNDGIPDSEENSVDLDSRIKNAIVSRHRVLSPAGSPGSPTKPIESGKHAERDGSITSAALDKKTISSIGEGNSEKKAKQRRRPRRDVESTYSPAMATNVQRRNYLINGRCGFDNDSPLVEPTISSILALVIANVEQLVMEVLNPQAAPVMGLGHLLVLIAQSFILAKVVCYKRKRR